MSTGSVSDGSASRRLTDCRFASSVPPKRTVISCGAYLLGAGVGSAGVTGVGATVDGGTLPPPVEGDVPGVVPSWDGCASTGPLSAGVADAVSSLTMPNGFLDAPSTLRRASRWP